mgnify:CR=1 FL=1
MKLVAADMQCIGEALVPVDVAIIKISSPSYSLTCLLM